MGLDYSVPTQSFVSQKKIRPSDSVKAVSEAETHNSKTHPFPQRHILSKNEASSQISPTKQTNLGYSPSFQQTSHLLLEQTITPMSFLPKFHLETPQMKPSPLSLTEPQPFQADDELPAVTLNPGSSQQHHPVSDPENTIHIYWLNQLNATQREQPSNGTELTDWKKRNTSQSPMTSNDPM